MGNVFPAELAEFAPFQPIRIVLLILHSGIVSLLADRAGQINDLSHLRFSLVHKLTREQVASSLEHFIMSARLLVILSALLS